MATNRKIIINNINLPINISDVSNLQDALNSKEPLISNGLPNQFFYYNKTWSYINISDISNLQNVLDSKEPLISNGLPNQFFYYNKTWSYINTDQIVEGSNLFYTNSRTINSVLNGLLPTSGTVTSSDTILSAFNKLVYDKHQPVTLFSSSGLILSGQQIGLGTPSTITYNSNNSVVAETHTHQIEPSVNLVGNAPFSYGAITSFTTYPYSPYWVSAANLFGPNGLNSLTYSSPGFVKITGNNSFSIDTNSYSLSNHTHGNITNDGKLSSTNRVVITDSSSTIKSANSLYATDNNIGINRDTVSGTVIAFHLDNTRNNGIWHTTSYITATTSMYPLSIGFKPRVSNSSTLYFQNQLHVYPVIDSTVTNSGYSRAVTLECLRNYDPTLDDSGTLNTLASALISYGHYDLNTSATPTTSSAFGLYIVGRRKSGSITDMYDIYISNDDGNGSVTNRYGIYQANTAYNRLGGVLELNSDLKIINIQDYGGYKRDTKILMVDSTNKIVKNISPPRNIWFLRENTTNLLYAMISSDTITITTVANRVYYIPFIPQSNIRITDIYINVLTPASGTANVALYNYNDSNNGSIIGQSYSLNTSTTGNKFVSGLSINLQGGVPYYIAICTSAAVGLIGISKNATFPALGFDVNGGINHFYKNQANNTLPSFCDFESASGGDLPAIFTQFSFV